jgi:RHS repeat-associated protein
MLGFCGALLTADSAAAADFTWTGAAPFGEPNWSNATNWGGTAPTGSIGTLTFPSLERSACLFGGGLPTETCQRSNNNLGGLAANALKFGCGIYELSGNALTLGAGGLTTSCLGHGESRVAFPITLGAKQTWLIEGGGDENSMGLRLEADVNGPSEPLEIQLVNHSFVTLPRSGHVEVGPVTIDGTKANREYFYGLDLEAGSLNGADGNEVSLVRAPISGPGTVGPLTSKGGIIRLPFNNLSVSGPMTLDSSTEIQTSIERGQQSEINVAGGVVLGNASLTLSGGEYCPRPGETYTLITTPGAISGVFAGLSDGGTTQIECQGVHAVVRLNYTTHSVTATVVGWEPYGGALRLLELLSGGHNPSEFCVVCFMGKLISFFSPVDAPTGNFWHTFEDLSVPGRGMALHLTRTYNSSAAATDGPFGFGWSFPYDMSLSFPDATHVVVNQENGSQVTFTEQSGGVYTAPPRVTAALVHNGDGSWTFVRRHKDTFSFDSSGRLTQEKDLNGYVTAVVHNGSGQLTDVTDPAGRKLTFVYSGNHVSSVSDPLGRVVAYAYDGVGNLTDVTDVNGGNTHFTYDSAHRMLTMRFPNQAPGVTGSTGAVVSNKYDGQGRVTEQTDQLGRTTKFAYAGEPFTGTGGSTTITDPKGNVIVQNYRFGELVSETKGYGTPQAATWTFGYDPATLGMTSVTDPNGHTTTSTFDSEGNTLTSTDALSRTTTNTYDSLNDLLTTTDPLGVTTTMVYDPKGNLLTRSRPLTGTAQTQTTTYTYGDATHPGDVTATTDPEGKTSKYTYDANGDRTSTADPLGNKATSTYNAVGWLLTTVSPRGNAEGANPASFTTTYAHNNFGQITETVDPLGHKTTSQYGPDQNPIASTDADGNTTTYTYDAADERTGVHRADGTTLQTTYWPDGAVKEQIDGAGHATHYEYDPLARVSAVTDPLGRVTRYGYDGAGNRTSLTDAEGRVTTTSYDAANEPTAITYSDGKTPNVSNITYDANGQRTGMTDGSGTWSWTWDSLHRLTNVTEGNNGTVKYQYDLRNDLTTITYPDGHSVMRGYDDAGRWTSVTDWLGNTTTFAYDPDQNMTTETLPVGAGITDTSTYANNDSLSSISDKHGASTLFAANYTRDANSQLTSDSSQSPSEGGFGYTPLNQLCYAGDSNTAPCSSPPSGAPPYQYDSANNLVRMGATTQTFDAANELTSASAPAGSGEQASGGGMSGGGVNGGGNVAKKGVIEQRVIPSVTSGKVTFTHTSGHGRPVVSQALSTNSGGDLVLAFVSAKGPRRGRQGVAVIKGGGLKWSLVTTASFHGGYVAIWKAQARKRLTRIRVSVSLRQRGYPAALAVVGFDSKAAVVRSAKGSSSKGAPHVAVAVPPDAVVWAVGQDTAQHPKPKPLPGQVLVAKPAVQSGGTSWIQSDNPQATERLMVGDSAPKSSSWALGAVTIREQAVTLPGKPPITQIIPAPVPGGSGLPSTTANGTLTYTYDAEGDRNSAIASTGVSQTYSYNQALELTGFGSEVSYTYNGDELRMSKTVGATTTPFTWDVARGLPLVLEDGTNAYVYGPGGLPLEQVSGNTALWFHHDQLGSTRLLTTGTGASATTYAYTPYGGLSSSSGTASTPLLFAGQYRDSESGLYYLRARYYDPTTAQFLGRDPAVSSTRSPFAYVAGNPINETDPSGQRPICAPSQLAQGANDCWDRSPADVASCQSSDQCQASVEVLAQTLKAGVDTNCEDDKFQADVKRYYDIANQSYRSYQPWYTPPPTNHDPVVAAKSCSDFFHDASGEGVSEMTAASSPHEWLFWGGVTFGTAVIGGTCGVVHSVLGG